MKKRQAKAAISGREQVAGILDKILSRKANRETIERALQAELEEDPVKFFRTYVLGPEQKRGKAEANPPAEGAALAAQVAEMAGAGAEPKPEKETP